MNVKPLICYWRPKDLPEVLAGLDSIDCDKLYLNYFPYPHNYTISRQFFLDHPEYTHYVALPNDLVPTKEIHERLIQLIKENDYPVISGVCNVDTGKYKDKINITSNLPVLAPYDFRRYFWVSKNKHPNKVLKVPWAGFPYMFIRRDVVEKIPFATVPEDIRIGHPIWEQTGGWGGDLAFAHSCKYHNIPIHVDTGCQMVHLRYHGEMLIGKKEPEVIFVKDGISTKIESLIKYNEANKA